MENKLIYSKIDLDIIRNFIFNNLSDFYKCSICGKTRIEHMHGDNTFVWTDESQKICKILEKSLELIENLRNEHPQEKIITPVEDIKK